LPPGHRLADRDTIKVEELGSEPLILLSATSELRERIVHTFERFNIPMNVQVETVTLESVKKMVAQRMGVGIVPRVCVLKEESNGELVVRSIREFHEQRSLWIATRHAPSPACQSFVKTMLSEVASLKIAGIPASAGA
jgi:DNA-binding transcriptional LysR family regulator